jgi:hypothetical protein
MLHEVGIQIAKPNGSDKAKSKVFEDDLLERNIVKGRNKRTETMNQFE